MPRLLNYTKPDVAGYKAIGATMGFGQIPLDVLFPGGDVPSNVVEGSPFPGSVYLPYDVPSNQMISTPMAPSTIQALSRAVSSYFDTPGPSTPAPVLPPTQQSWISTNWPYVALGGLVVLLLSRR